MAELTPDIAAEVREMCTSGAAEAAEALGRALDAEGVQLSVGEADNLKTESLPEEFSAAGLVVVMTVGSTAALVLLPEPSGFLPSWCADPDPTGQSKLTTLAQELGMILLPEEYASDDFRAAWVPNLAEALARAETADGAASLSLTLSLEDKSGLAYLIWPAAKPADVIEVESEKTAEAASDTPEKQATSAEEPDPAPAVERSAATKPAAATAEHPAIRADILPLYSRSLLRVKVPVVVTLAQKHQPLGRIIELGPGSIIQFDKSCEEMLDLDVGDHRVATGEAVKVGDKFGLRITSMILPEERFKPVRPPTRS